MRIAGGFSIEFAGSECRRILHGLLRSLFVIADAGAKLVSGIHGPQCGGSWGPQRGRCGAKRRCSYTELLVRAQDSALGKRRPNTTVPEELVNCPSGDGWHWLSEPHRRHHRSQVSRRAEPVCGGDGWHWLSEPHRRHHPSQVSRRAEPVCGGDGWHWLSEPDRRHHRSQVSRRAEPVCGGDGWHWLSEPDRRHHRSQVSRRAEPVC